ncbi:MAG: hypothetical protein VB086_03220, partial [Clostridiaceae bacterium]|nr:hypothetical protein [Clostridiaceae bacterium]
LQGGARMFGGTDLRLLGRALAGRFGLFYLTTDDQGTLRRHLGAGKAAIVNVGGNREGHPGLLSDGGHYVAVLGEEGGLFTVADPKSSPEKYGPKYPHRRAAIRRAGVFLRISPADLESDCLLRSPRYHLFG